MRHCQCHLTPQDWALKVVLAASAFADAAAVAPPLAARTTTWLARGLVCTLPAGVPTFSSAFPTFASLFLTSAGKVILSAQ